MLVMAASLLAQKEYLSEEANLPYHFSAITWQGGWASPQTAKNTLGHMAALEFVEKAGYQLTKVTLLRDNKRKYHKGDFSASS